MPRTRNLLIFSTLLLAIFAATSPIQAKQDHIKPEDQLVAGTPLSASDKTHLLEDKFVLVKTVAAIPQLVQKKIISGGIREGMADAGQPYEISDMVGPKPLPFRRLVFAGTSPGYCIVYNEYGGYGAGQEVSLYRLSPNLAILVWRADLRGDSSHLTLSQLRDAVSKSKLYKKVR